MSITATIAEEPKSVSFAGPGLVPKQGDKKGNSSAQAATDDSTENDPRMDDEVFISAVEVELVDEGGSHPMAAEIRQRTVAEVGLRPNFLHKIRDVKEDMERIFDLGWFSQVTPVTQDTRDGVKVTYEVRLLPEIKSVQMEGVSRLPASYLQSLFHDLPGQIMNWPVIVQKVKSINQWYSSNDLLGQVVDVNHDTASGQLRIKVGEATVDKLDLKFVSPNDPTKKRSRGMTRRDIIMRNVTTRPGQVYDKKQIERDLTAVEATGLFNSVSFVPSPTADCTDTNPRVHLDLEVEEKKMRGFSAGLGMSTLMQGLGVSPQGTIGNLALHHRNLFGCNQELKATMELGQQDRVFKVTHNDPWPRTNRNRTSRHVSVSNERTSGAPFFAKTHEQMAGEQNGPLHSSMTPRSPQGPPAAGPASGLGLAGDNGRDSAGSSSVVNIARLVGHLEWSMPLTDRISVNWGGSAWRARGLDAFGRVANRDDYGEVILYSSNADQDYAVQASAKAHYRGENVEAVVGVEQGLPMIPFQDCLVFSKVSGRAEGQVSLGLLQAVLAVKSGLLHGSCPPYLAFPLGGTNSIRGYTEGGVGTARRFVTATGELRVPLIPGQASPKPEEEEQGRPTHKKTPPLIQGTVFADIGTDFESGKDVVADPAGSRGKPGHGHGYGLGVRVQSPLGPLRLEYALNAMREGRFHVGIGFYG